MRNLVIITSIIEMPNKPLSYSKTRSIFSNDERFEQTKKTIETIKGRMEDVAILIIECGDFKDNMEKCESIKQLVMTDTSDLEDSFLFRLSKLNTFNFFNNVALVSSFQDKFVPR